MNLVLTIVIVSALTGHLACAQALSVQIQNGNVFFRDVGGVHRLTHDGQNSKPAKSRDGRLIAYVRTDGQNADSANMNSLHICNLPTHRCQKVVSAMVSETPQKNLTNITSPVFSFQASVGPDGAVIGSVFFQTDAWATSGAVHRVTLGAIRRVTFVTDSNGFSVVPSGRFAGALDVCQHRYLPQGGSLDRESIMDPNTGMQLELLPTQC